MNHASDVSVRCCLHFLCCADLLRFARCSRRTFAQADSRFAWLHTPLRITSDHDAILPAFHSLRLLRHAPSSFRWLASSHRSFLFVPQSLQAHHRLTELDLREAARAGLWHATSAVTPAALLHILQRHRKLLILRLHSASVPGEVNPAMLQSIFSLERCHTLSVMPRASDITSWEGLSGMPALTSLDMSDVGKGEADSASRLHAVALCTRLEHLSISRPRVLGSEGFLRFFIPPSQSQGSNLARTLRSLTLDQMDDLSSVPVADVQAVMAAMQSLQRLCLRHARSAHVLVQSLAAVKSMRELILEPLCIKASFAEPLWSSSDVLQEALLHNPLLHLCVRLPYARDNDADDNDEDVGNAYHQGRAARRIAISQLASMLQKECKPQERCEIVFLNTHL